MYENKVKASLRDILLTKIIIVLFQPDNIAEKLKDVLEPGYFTNLDGFLGQLPKEIHFKPFGEKIHEYNFTKSKSSLLI